MWAKLDEPLKMFRTRRAAIRGSSAMPGPSTAKATEAFTKYVITDMYAKARAGHEGRGRRASGPRASSKKIYEG